MTKKENISERFEDLDDMFDGICEDLSKVIHRWILFSKITMQDSVTGEMSKEVLDHLVDSEFSEKYCRTFPVLEKCDNGVILTGVLVNGDEEPVE